MSESVTLARDQNPIDAEHLRLLAIFHFVAVGLAVCGLLFVAAHFAIFYSLMASPQVWGDSKQGPPPAQILTMMRWFYAFFALWFAASAAVNLASAFFLRARRHRVFSMVVAGLNCVYVPFGTMLGVFTLIVLARDSVVRMYEA